LRDHDFSVSATPGRANGAIRRFLVGASPQNARMEAPRCLVSNLTIRTRSGTLVRPGARRIFRRQSRRSPPELYNWFTISGPPAALPAIHRELLELLGEAAAERMASPVVARDRLS
jgi:hypothetical protein